ncbi:MAG: transporter ATP-binding protein [Frankiales bacterium]|jgi:CRP-like cAMP-binding protein|nr:transporter ATP-binding protein [Frankiales bacterium]
MWNRYRHPLGRLPLLDGASDAVVQQLASLMTSVRVPAGEVLVRQGAHNRQFLLVEEGEILVERDGVQVARLGRGDFVGEISLLGDGIATATVTAATDVVLYASSTAEFAGLLHSTVGDTITHTAAERAVA